MAERVIILGTGPVAARVAAELAMHPDAGALFGVIVEAPKVEPEFDCLVLGALPDLRRILTEQRPDRVVVAMRDEYRPLSADLLVEIQAYRGLVVETGMDACERITGKVAIESLDARSVLFSSGFRPSRPGMWFARAYSLIAAACGFVVFLPVMGLAALAIRLDSPGPVLFVQERIGLGNRRFKLLKFRSMRVAEGRRSEWEGDNVDRITRTGRWLRKFRLDELPQFINVLRGDMNLVGPRPHPDSNRRLFILVSRNTPECGEQIPYYSLRSSIRPGITGWAQVRYKYANGLDEEIEKLRYDLYYIKHYSPLLDLRILLETVKVVCLGHRKLESNAVSRQPIEDFADEPDTMPAGQPLLPGLARALRSRAYAHPVKRPQLGPDRLGGAP
jgi:lipopolysaccharide/colanic/teichoic acid biosynthesis glycosyltransferase